MDQFAAGLTGTRTPYGTPVNALDERVIPGGSSSGSASAVASGAPAPVLCLLGLAYTCVGHDSKVWLRCRLVVATLSIASSVCDAGNLIAASFMQARHQLCFSYLHVCVSY